MVLPAMRIVLLCSWYDRTVVNRGKRIVQENRTPVFAYRKD